MARTTDDMPTLSGALEELSDKESTLQYIIDQFSAMID